MLAKFTTSAAVGCAESLHERKHSIDYIRLTLEVTDLLVFIHSHVERSIMFECEASTGDVVLYGGCASVEQDTVDTSGTQTS